MAAGHPGSRELFRGARDTPLARALFAVDEISGFLVACALVRPSKSLKDLEVASVKKKFKDKAFAGA
jgi:predicted hydrolase (HD superfamily)